MSEEVLNPSEQKTSQTDVFAEVSPEVKIRTKKMMMWLIIFAIVMLFGGITSALIVLYGKLMWVHINAPSALWISNVLVVLSSLSIWMAVRALKKGDQKNAQFLTALTFALGLGFVFTQNAGWSALKSRGMGYTVIQNEQGLKSYHWNTLGKLSGEYGKDYFIEWNGQKIIQENGAYYAENDLARSKDLTNQVMTTFNASGAMLSVLIYVHIAHLFFGLIYLLVNTVRIAKRKLHKDNLISIYSGGMYWHFMGILWLYLFFFVFFIY